MTEDLPTLEVTVSGAEYQRIASGRTQIIAKPRSRIWDERLQDEKGLAREFGKVTIRAHGYEPITRARPRLFITVAVRPEFNNQAKAVHVIKLPRYRQ